MFPKKIKKIWKQRREYISKNYWIKKIIRETKVSSSANYSHDTSVSERKQRDGDIPKLAIYTCIYGNYDGLKEPFIKGKYCDYYIITDQKVNEKSTWKKIEPIGYPEGFETWHPAMKNRYYKMHPQDLFEQYEYSIYVDGNVRPIADLYPLLEIVRKKKMLIGMFTHPIFNCLYDSAEHLKKINLVDFQKMDLQIEAYRKAGFPTKFGFFECNLILRKHNDSLCCAIMEDWWNEYMDGVKRDQQSFTYVLWKNGLKCSDICSFGENIRNNPRVKIRDHKREHEKVV